MTDNEPTILDIGDLPMDLDHSNAFVAAQALETGANAIRMHNKYPEAATFLERFASILYDLATARAQADGVEARPEDEVEAKMRDAQRRHLN